MSVNDFHDACNRTIAAIEKSGLKGVTERDLMRQVPKAARHEAARARGRIPRPDYRLRHCQSPARRQGTPDNGLDVSARY
jgi:hypothetical protein